MFVKCKNCGTTYNLDEKSFIGEKIRVRCSRCRFIFSITNPNPKAEAETARGESQAPSIFLANSATSRTSPKTQFSSQADDDIVKKAIPSVMAKEQVVATEKTEEINPIIDDTAVQNFTPEDIQRRQEDHVESAKEESRTFSAGRRSVFSALNPWGEKRDTSANRWQKRPLPSLASTESTAKKSLLFRHKVTLWLAIIFLATTIFLGWSWFFLSTDEGKMLQRKVVAGLRLIYHKIN
ncbi:MAG: zinc-ribbon domain-containing protein [Deltaproteobacteria bacterium]|nr:zinc-ribbon domain-containing protein [Deltaproteobacteria bacterium]